MEQMQKYVEKFSLNVFSYRVLHEFEKMYYPITKKKEKCQKVLKISCKFVEKIEKFYLS
jgi:hypothetical protein